MTTNSASTASTSVDATKNKSVHPRKEEPLSHRFLIEYECPPMAFEDFTWMHYVSAWRGIKTVLRYCKRHNLHYTITRYR